MPILIKEYEFQEDEEHLYLTVSLNGKNPKNVDIYCNDSYLKINVSPFFFELDFFERVDEDTSSANITQTDVKISIKKETPKLWGRASLFTEEERRKPENKELIKKRRDEAFERSLEKAKEKQKQKRIFFNNQKREMVQKQMDVEKAEKEKIKEIKTKAAEDAKKDLYSWLDNEKQGNPNFINSKNRRRRYEDNDEGRIREIDSDEEEEEEDYDDEIDANVDIWSDHEDIVEFNDDEEEKEQEEEEEEVEVEEEPEESVDPWDQGIPGEEMNDFMKQSKKLDSLVKRRREKDNKQQQSSQQHNKEDTKTSKETKVSKTSDTPEKKSIVYSSKTEDKEWERLTEVQTTEDNSPVVTEEKEGNNELQSQPLTEENKNTVVNEYKGEVLEDISSFNSDEDEDEFDMEAIQAKVRKEMEQKKEKELMEKLGKRYYRMSKSEERTLPPPRALNQRINITFTPRDRPTAARESEDEKYRNHMKRQRAIKASLDKLHDSKGIQEESAVYLKEKGNIFYKHEDYEGAINAYTSALELEPENIGCLSNRSVCYLKLKKYDECLKDCDKAITTLKSIKEEFDYGANNAEPITVPFTRTHELALMKLLIRRGATYVTNKKYQEALKDYTEALEFDKRNETILHDIEQIKKAING